MIKELGFDSGEQQQIINTSQLPLGPYWNLNTAYVLGNGFFSRGLKRPQREAEH